MQKADNSAKTPQPKASTPQLTKQQQQEARRQKMKRIYKTCFKLYAIAVLVTIFFIKTRKNSHTVTGSITYPRVFGNPESGNFSIDIERLHAFEQQTAPGLQSLKQFKQFSDYRVVLEGKTCPFDAEATLPSAQSTFEAPSCTYSECDSLEISSLSDANAKGCACSGTQSPLNSDASPQDAVLPFDTSSNQHMKSSRELYFDGSQGGGAAAEDAGAHADSVNEWLESDFREKSRYVDLMDLKRGYFYYPDKAGAWVPLWSLARADSASEAHRAVTSGAVTSAVSHVMNANLDHWNGHQVVPIYWTYLATIGSNERNYADMYAYYALLVRAYGIIGAQAEKFQYLDPKIARLVAQFSQAVKSGENGLFAGAPEASVAFDLKNLTRHTQKLIEHANCLKSQSSMTITKIHLYGLATALDILQTHAEQGSVVLTRLQLQILVQAIIRTSESLETISNMYAEQVGYLRNVSLAVFASLGTFILFIGVLIQFYLTLRQRVRNMFKHVFPQNDSLKKMM